MKFNYRMWLVTLFLVIGSLALPAAAQACGSCCKGGKIFNETDGRFYPIPSKSCGVYRSVNGKYIRVSGYSCHKHHHKCMMVGVRCEVRPAHWWVTTWVPVSRECWYVNVR